MVSAVVRTATGVNAVGHREVLGLRVATTESSVAWNGLLADLVARGLTGVRLVTSDAHTGLVEAIAANLPGATWQRCRTHYAANLMTVVPKSLWPVEAQFDRLLDYVHTILPEAADHLEAARADLLAYRRLPCRGMETELVQQPPRTPQQRDPSPHRLSRDLPQQGRHYPPGWRRPSRADRWSGPKDAATSVSTFSTTAGTYPTPPLSPANDHTPRRPLHHIKRLDLECVIDDQPTYGAPDQGDQI